MAAVVKQGCEPCHKEGGLGKKEEEKMAQARNQNPLRGDVSRPSPRLGEGSPRLGQDRGLPGAGSTWGVMDLSPILIAVLLSLANPSDCTFKHTPLVVCQLYLNKAVKPPPDKLGNWTWVFGWTQRPSSLEQTGSGLRKNQGRGIWGRVGVTRWEGGYSLAAQLQTAWVAGAPAGVKGGREETVV